MILYSKSNLLYIQRKFKQLQCYEVLEKQIFQIYIFCVKLGIEINDFMLDSFSSLSLISVYGKQNHS